MDKRPHYTDTEEEILRQQTEFLKNKVKPAVKLLKSDELAAKISNAPVQSSQINEGPSLIGSIIQKDTTNILPSEMNIRFSQGFPKAKRRNLTPSSKGSLFSQQSNSNKRLKNEINLPEKSYIISGENSQNIHTENVEVLTKMSETEILAERNQLLNSLDPNLIKFLQSKRQQNKMQASHLVSDMDVSNDTHISNETHNSNESQTSNDAQKSNKATDTTTTNDSPIKPIVLNTPPAIGQIQTPTDLVNQSENWLHFDTIETEKLEWMKNIETCDKPEQYEARFDFSGCLLPYSDEISETNRSLYHHGEESGRPGYTLKELFKLGRSTVHQQRILALTTISNILSLNSTGIYDKIIEIPLEQIFFVVRISLDDNSPNILNASLKAMHSLVVCQLDEQCLDLIQSFGCVINEPLLTVAQNVDEKDLNDQQLSETDLIRCLVRSDIFTRIRYILNTIKPSSQSVIYCLEILIRLLRDSEQTIEQFYRTDELLSRIVEYFVPKIYKLENTQENCYGKPVVAAIKLLRIICCRSREIAEDLIKRYPIIEALLSYISNQITDTTIGVKLQVETFKLLAILFRHNLALDAFTDFQPFLLSYLDFHFRNNSLNNHTLQTHFSGLLSIISEVTKHNYNLVHNFVPLLVQTLAKSCAQVSNLTNFKSAQLSSVSAILVTLTDVVKAGSALNAANTDSIVLGLLNSVGFKNITDNIMLSSNLFCLNEPHKSSANMAMLESAVWNNIDHVVPVLGLKSCVPFLQGLSYYMVNSQLAPIFLQHSNINKYLVALKKADKFYLTNNWFTKHESALVMNLLKCVVASKNTLPNLFFYFEVTVRCLSIFTVEQSSDIDYLLKNIVFNKQFYPNEMLLKEMSINNEVVSILPDLHNIYLCYSEVLGLKKNTTNLMVNAHLGSVVPVDWIFSPIVAMYAQDKQDETRQTIVVTRCLQWICLHDQYFPDLSINITDKFCRLSCIFLCSNTLFLEPVVHKLLESCLKFLIRNLETLDFNKTIQGLNNFQDFYIQLLEQYQGVSYGDKLFANFIIIPLAQRHDCKWRKILWSEYLGVAQTINLELNECLTRVDDYVTPAETDISLLKCYRRALLSEQLNRCPLLKHIANFHVENFVKNV